MDPTVDILGREDGIGRLKPSVHHLLSPFSPRDVFYQVYYCGTSPLTLSLAFEIRLRSSHGQTNRDATGPSPKATGIIYIIRGNRVSAPPILPSRPLLPAGLQLHLLRILRPGVVLCGGECRMICLLRILPCISGLLLYPVQSVCILCIILLTLAQNSPSYYRKIDTKIVIISWELFTPTSSLVAK